MPASVSSGMSGAVVSSAETWPVPEVPVLFHQLTLSVCRSDGHIMMNRAQVEEFDGITFHWNCSTYKYICFID